MSHARAESKQSSSSSKSETEEESDRGASASGTGGPGPLLVGGPAVRLGASTRSTHEVSDIQMNLTVNEPVSITTRADGATVHRKPDGDGGTGGDKQSKGDQRKGETVTHAVEYGEAISTLGKALMQTELGKRLKREGKELGTEFWSTVGGKVVTLTAGAGGLTFLGVTNRPLPLQPPAFRPDALIPGLKVPGLRVQVAYQGPVRDPTKVGLGASFQFGAETPGVMLPGLGDPKLRLDVSSKDPFKGGLESPKVMLKFSFTTGKSSRQSQNNENQGDSPARELHQFRQSLKTPEERAAERRMLMEMLAPGLDLSEVQRNVPDDSPSGVIQRKLTVDEPNDQYEKEAERVADAVMRMSDPARVAPTQKDDPPVSIHRMPAWRHRCYRQAAPLHRKKWEAELRKKAVSVEDSAVDDGVEQRIQSLQAGGRALPKSVRSYFEPRFGADFSDVRIHTDRRADETARALNANAFTVGKDVAFRSGMYHPDTEGGKRLLAHELTHVVQQGALRSLGSRRRQYGGPIQDPRARVHHEIPKKEREDYFRADTATGVVHTLAGAKNKRADEGWQWVNSTRGVTRTLDQLAARPEVWKFPERLGKSLGSVTDGNGMRNHAVPYLSGRAKMQVPVGTQFVQRQKNARPSEPPPLGPPGTMLLSIGDPRIYDKMERRGYRLDRTDIFGFEYWYSKSYDHWVKTKPGASAQPAIDPNMEPEIIVATAENVSVAGLVGNATLYETDKGTGGAIVVQDSETFERKAIFILKRWSEKEARRRDHPLFVPLQDRSIGVYNVYDSGGYFIEQKTLDWRDIAQWDIP